MAAKPVSKEELNFCKFAFIVQNEFPKMLRQTFVTMWNNKIACLPGYQVWDDSPIVRSQLLKREGGKTRIPTTRSVNEWDCTALVQAIIYSSAFGSTSSSSTKSTTFTLAQQYLKGKKPDPFHFSVISPTGNQDESFTLAIDQLRLLRKMFCRHVSKPVICKADYDHYVQLAKDAFTATGVSTLCIDDIDWLIKEDFPVEKVNEINEGIKTEHHKLLQEEDGQVPLLESLHEFRSDVSDQSRGKDKKQTWNSNEICKNTNDTVQPPVLNISLPELRGIKPEHVHWSNIESYLPIDLLLVTVNDHELASCYNYIKNIKRSYCNDLGWVNFGKFCDGKVKVALIRCGKNLTEPHASIMIFKNAVEILRPKVAICVGHCAAVNPEKAKLGDVVISTKLASFSSKDITKDGKEELHGIKTHVSQKMRHLILHATDGWVPPLKEPRDFEIEVHHNRVMLSGPELVYNIERRQELLTYYPDAIAVEMEGEGLYSSAYDLGIEWLVIKGISRLADESKETGNWQPFASAMAASIVFNMFKFPDALEHWPHYQSPVDEITKKDLDPDTRATCHDAVRYGEKRNNHVSLLFIGHCGVGKTSLKKSLLGEELESNEKEHSTVGIELDVVEVNERNISKAWRRSTDEQFMASEDYSNYFIVKDVVKRKTEIELKPENEDGVPNGKTENKEGGENGKKVKKEHRHGNEDKTKSERTEIREDGERETHGAHGSKKEDDGKSSTINLFTDELKDKIEQVRRNIDNCSDDTMDTIRFLLGDVGGQSVYYNIHSIMLRNMRSLFILVIDLEKPLYDIAQPTCVDKETKLVQKLENPLGETNLDYAKKWMAALRDLHPRDTTNEQKLEKFREKNKFDNPKKTNLPKVLVVFTKPDTLDSREVERRASEASKALSECFGSLIVAKYIIKSTLPRNEEENRELQELRMKMFKTAQEVLLGQQKTPLNWIVLERVLGYWMKTKQLPFITLDEARELGRQCEVKETFDNAMKFLHEENIVVHFNDELVVLDPSWLVELLTQVITVPQDRNCGGEVEKAWIDLTERGILNFKRLQDPFPEYSQKEALKTMMVTAGLICHWKDDVYFVPSMVTNAVEKKQIQKLLSSCLKPSLYIVFDGDCMPLGFFTRMQVEFLKWCLGNTDGYTYEIFCNFSRFVRKENGAEYHVILVRHISRIQVAVLGVKNCTLDSVARSVLSFIRQAIEFIGLNHTSLKFTLVKLGLKCDVCCEKSTKCPRHQEKACTDDDCVCILDLERFNKDSVSCYKDKVALSYYSKLHKSPWVKAAGETLDLQIEGFSVIKEDRIANRQRENQLEQQNYALKCQLQKQMAQMKTRIDRAIELEEVNNSLVKQLGLLRVKYTDTLAELGQITFEHSSKANEERNYKVFQEIYRSTPPGPKRSLVSTCNDRSTTEDARLDYPNDVQYNHEDYIKSSHGNGYRANDSFPNGCTNSFPKGFQNGSRSSVPSGRLNDSVIVSLKSYSGNANDSSNPLPEVYRTGISLRQQPVQGAKATMQGNKNEVEEWKKVMTTGEQNGSKYRARDQTCPEVSTNRHNSEHQSPLRHGSMRRTSNCLQKEETRSGEGVNQFKEFEDAKRTSDLKSTSKDESNEQTSTRQNCEGLSFSIQQDDSSGRENISLDQNVPHTSVATILYNNYKLLLLTLTQRLLSRDFSELTNWANQKFSIDISQSSADVLFKLDKKGIIHASNLSQLRDFFESILRIDLVYIIDAFLLGDYSLLRQTPTSKKRHAEANGPQNLQFKDKSAYTGFPNAANAIQYSSQGSANTVTTVTMSEAARNNFVDGPTFRRSADRNLATSRKPENNDDARGLVYQDTHKAACPHFSAQPNTTDPKHYSRTPNENQGTACYQQQNFQSNPNGFTESDTRMPAVVVADGPVTCERTTTSSNSLTSRSPPVRNLGRTTQTVGSNGLKLSKFRHPDTERSNVSTAKSNGARNQANGSDEDGHWLCSHYKRRCYISFECCDKFWPCHRCHNNQSTCGRKKLKSRDTKMVKCVNCDKVQQFIQFCCDCNTKFANYYCGLCKHLTGEDDHPYHCDKCGICRIHGDRSFHCDICGVCLDVQLQGNHKCREGSAHDECCICLEDAFTGCQILPCSHKVHKDCATHMIRSGITRCPICRESFAHKLERRPLSKSQKRSGK